MSFCTVEEVIVQFEYFGLTGHTTDLQWEPNKSSGNTSYIDWFKSQFLKSIMPKIFFFSVSSKDFWELGPWFFSVSGWKFKFYFRWLPEPKKSLLVDCLRLLSKLIWLHIFRHLVKSKKPCWCSIDKPIVTEDLDSLHLTQKRLSRKFVSFIIMKSTTKRFDLEITLLLHYL